VLVARCRLVALLLLLAGALVATRLAPLAAIYAAAVILCVLADRFRQHVAFATVVLAPVGIVGVAVWGFIVSAPPGAPIKSDPLGGAIYAAMIALRLGTVGAAVQWFAAVPADQLIGCLRANGLRGGALTIIAGALAIVPEMRLRAEQVQSARLARGLVRPSRLGWIAALPSLLLPLSAWSLRSAIHRADAWYQRGLLTGIDALDPRMVLPSDRRAENTAVTVVALAAVLLLVSVAWR
jgi:hypothetical protein